MEITTVEELKRHVEETGICICGHPVMDIRGRRGRPRQWCSRDCGKLWSAISTLQLYLVGGASHTGSIVISEADSFSGKATNEGWSGLRGILFRLCNVRSATRGVPHRGSRDARGRFCTKDKAVSP